MYTDMKTMVLMAHADDESLGAGGLIQQLAISGSRITIIYASDGIVTVRGKIQDNRPGAKMACKILGVKSLPIFIGYKDQQLDKYTIAEIANAISQLHIDPDLIISHASTDLNLDHRIISDVAKIIGRPISKPISILGCEISNNSSWNGIPFPANYYVNITSSEMSNKILAFSQYKNELMQYPHPCSAKAIKLRSKYNGMQSGSKYAEAYQIIRGCSGHL